jgi:glycosyltransferase involved in cell wall biosynthesis
MPLVSVIVPAYKVTPYIAETLDSLLAQTFQDFEIVLVNDGCPDSEALERVLEPYRSRIIYVRQDNQGLSCARNAAIRSGTATKYIALLDGDDKWHPEYLEVQTGIMEQDSSIDVLYSDAFVFGDGPGSGRLLTEMWPSHGEVTVQALLDQTCTVMISVLARRAIVEKVGLFDTTVKPSGSEDFDLWFRILKAGGRISYHQRPLVYYRRRPTSLSSNSVAICQSFIHVLSNLLQRPDLSPAERSRIEQRLAGVEGELCWEQGRLAISRGDAREAIEKLACANRTFRTRRLNLIIAALRICPLPTIQVYRLRQRMLRRGN